MSTTLAMHSHLLHLVLRRCSSSHCGREKPHKRRPPLPRQRSPQLEAAHKLPFAFSFIPGHDNVWKIRFYITFSECTVFLTIMKEKESFVFSLGVLVLLLLLIPGAVIEVKETSIQIQFIMFHSERKISRTQIFFLRASVWAQPTKFALTPCLLARSATFCVCGLSLFHLQTRTKSLRITGKYTV